MPNKIPKRADSNDPRTWTWLPYGWYQECMPPLKWRMQTTGVTQYFQRLNGGLVLPLKTSVLTSAEWELWDFYPAGPIWQMAIDTYPGATFPSASVTFTITIELPGYTNPQYSVRNLFEPNPYLPLAFDMLDAGSPSTIIPNQVSLVPQPYWVDDSP